MRQQMCLDTATAADFRASSSHWKVTVSLRLIVCRSRFAAGRQNYSVSEPFIIPCYWVKVRARIVNGGFPLRYSFPGSQSCESEGGTLLTFYLQLPRYNIAPSSPVVRDLGIYLDSGLTTTAHISKTVSNCFAALRQIRSVRRSLPTQITLRSTYI